MGRQLGYQFQVIDSLQGWRNMVRGTPQRPDGNPDRVVGDGHGLPADSEVAPYKSILNKDFFKCIANEAGREMMSGIVPLIKYLLAPGGIIFTVF